MANRKKPVPYYSDDTSKQTHDSSRPSSFAESETRRDTFSDAPTSSGAIGYANIEDALSQLQSRYSTGSRSSVRSLPAPPAEGSTRAAHADQASVSRYSASSASTAVERDGYGYSGDKKLDSASDDTHFSYDHTQHPQPTTYLPTINSGEPLEWDNLIPQPNDPFGDSSVPVYAHTGYGYDDSRPSLNSDNPYSSTVSHQFVPDTYQVFDQPVIPAITDGYVDHFHHDTEAYASGIYSRASYHPPRSRSPTPAVDDEDYHVVGNDSLHYTGHDAPYYSPEKTTPSQYLYPDGEYAESEKATVASTPLTPLPTMHFGPAPSGRIQRRKKKRVQLTNGNMAVELDVPPKLILPRKGEHEMMKTRYTAITCDPDDFAKSGLSLRQNEWGRTTELFIVVTMFNEDEILFCRTLYGIMQNIAHLCSRKNSRTWGPDAWKKVVICIVADGRRKVHPRVLDCLTLLGVYQPGVYMKHMIAGKAVTAHLFEYTTSFALDPNLHFKYPDKGIVPTQIMFCMKEKNMQKINSHRWFFNAFAPMLQPNVCVLLDVGTRPGPKSIYHLWKTFDINSNVGGACGEIAAYKGKHWSGLLNPLMAAQNFEYKMSNILDKPTESMFGYISVLPGAFSAYRYIALQNDKDGVGPLASYFKGEVLHGRDTDIFTSNMYLAEDRILCFELVAKPNCNWVLRYVKGAIGETDVPDALPEFILQRRRWLNGSFFAATYAIAHAGQILRAGHSVGRKTMLMIETVYNIINLVFAWFAMGNFYLFFTILTSSLGAQNNAVKYFNSVVQCLMAALLIACFLFSMGNKPRTAKWKYKLTAIVFALLTIYMFIGAVICALQAASSGGSAYSVMLFSIIATYGVYAVSSVLAFDPWHMLTSFIPYMLLSPTYINILNIYAFCNLDDISWGTKQDTADEMDLGSVAQNRNHEVEVEVFTEAADVNALYVDAAENLKIRKPVDKPNAAPNIAEQEQAAKDYYAGVRTNVLLAWVLSNGLLVVSILGTGDSSTTFSDPHVTPTKGYMTFILVFVAITSCIRFFGSTLYLLVRIFTG